MAENDLSIIVKTKLDPSGAEKDLDNLIDKYSGDKNSVTIPIRIDPKSAKEASRSAIEAINKNIGNASNIKLNFDVDSSGIKELVGELKKLGAAETEIQKIVKHLESSQMTVTKITQGFKSVNNGVDKLNRLTIEGTLADGKKVKQSMLFNKNKKIELETAKTISKQYAIQTKQTEKIAKTSNARNIIASRNREKSYWQNRFEESIHGSKKNYELENLKKKLAAESKIAEETDKNLRSKSHTYWQNRFEESIPGPKRNQELESLKQKLAEEAKIAEKQLAEEVKIAKAKQKLQEDQRKASHNYWQNRFEESIPKSKKNQELENLKQQLVEESKIAEARQKLQEDQRNTSHTYWQNRFKESIPGPKKNQELENLKKQLEAEAKLADKQARMSEKQEHDRKQQMYEDLWRKQDEYENRKEAKLAKSLETTKLPQTDVIKSLIENHVQTSGGVATSGVSELGSKIDLISKKYQSFIEELRTPDLTEDRFNQIVAELKLLDSEFTNVSTSAKKFGNDLNSQLSQAKVDSAVGKMKSQLSNMEVNWSAALEIPEFKARIEEMKLKLQSVDSVNLSKVQSEFQELRADIKAAGADCLSFGGQVKSVLSKISGFVSTADIIMTIRRGITTAVENVKNLDSAMVELKKVTDLTSAAYDKFVDKAGSRSKDVGTTLVDYVAGTADFSRLGYNLQDAQHLSESANILFKVGDDLDSIDDSTDAIIASMKAYGLQVSDVTSIIDQLNAVSNKTSISTGGLADAITRSASALNLGGLNLEKSLALIVAGNEATRDSAMTGNALKTLSMRIRGAKSELSEAGEEVDQYVESTSKMREEVKALTGVDIMIDDENFKDLYTIMGEIAEKYDTLTDIGKANLTEILFGKTIICRCA